MERFLGETSSTRNTSALDILKGIQRAYFLAGDSFRHLVIVPKNNLTLFGIWPIFVWRVLVAEEVIPCLEYNPFSPIHAVLVKTKMNKNVFGIVDLPSKQWLSSSDPLPYFWAYLRNMVDGNY